MCGRVVTTSSHLELSRYLGVHEVREASEHVDYNVAPSGCLPLVWVESGRDDVRRADIRVLGTAKWGLVPRWARSPVIGARTFTARAETLASKPTYRAAYRRRRCLIPVDGFYEWGPGTETKQPWFIYARDQAPLVVAGLWECWRLPGEGIDELRTCTVITVPANKDLLPVHHRMPAILPSEAWADWLDPGHTRSETLDVILRTKRDGLLARHPVAHQVNNPRNNGPELLKKLADFTNLHPLEQGRLW